MNIKMILRLFSIFIVLNTTAQTYNLSGIWKGTIAVKDDDSTFIGNFTLNIKLIDKCNLIYRVEQIETGTFNSSHIEYNFIQSKNTLLRDGMSHFKDYDNGSSGGLAHLKLSFKNGVLKGERRSYRDTRHDKIVLYPNKKTFPIIEDCDDIKPIKTNTICLVNNKSIFVDTIKVYPNSEISISLSDNKTQDGDNITLFSGNKTLLTNIPIYSNTYILPMKITSDTLITWCACNQGTGGLNTGIFVVSCNGVSKRMDVQLKTNEKASFYIKVKEYESKVFVTEIKN